MGSNSPLTTIIRKVEKSRLPEVKKGTIIYFDTETSKIVPKPKLSLGSLFGSPALDYYVVDSDRQVELEFKNILLRDFETDTQIDLDIDCSLLVTLDKQLSPELGISQLLKRAQRHENLYRTIESILTEAINDFGKGQGSIQQFIFGFYQKEAKRSIIKYLKEKLETYGFLAELRIKPTHEGFIDINSSREEHGHISVYFKDYTNPINVEFQYHLSQIPGKRILILLNEQSLEEIPSMVRSTILSVLKQYSLNEFREEINNDIKRKLLEVLDSKVMKFGYQLGLSLKYDSGNLPGGGIKEAEYGVKCTIRNYEEKIEIENKVLYSIRDYGRFMQEGIEDIFDWIKGELEEICRRNLFDKSYLDIVFDRERAGTERIEYQIISEMQARAKSIGIEINQHFILPALAPLKLKEEGLNINISKEYATKRSEIKIRVQLLLSARIKDLREVQSYIERQIDLEEKIMDRAVRIIERKLHAIEPEHALLFNALSKWQSDEDSTCEQILIKSLEQELQEFSLDQLEITLKADESKLKRRIAALSKGTHTFKVNAFSHWVNENSEEVTFQVEYKINGVDPERWAVFHKDDSSENEESSTLKEIKAIEETLKMDFRHKLETMPIEVLRYTDFITSRKIQTETIEPAKEKIAENYGLIISFVNFLRTSTTWESVQLTESEAEAESYVKTRKKLRKGMAKNKIQEVDDLQKSLKQLIEGNENGVHDEEIRNLNDQINSIIGEQPTYTSSKALTGRSEIDKDFSFGDFNNQIDPNKELPKNTETKNESKQEDNENIDQ